MGSQFSTEENFHTMIRTRASLTTKSQGLLKTAREISGLELTVEGFKNLA